VRRFLTRALASVGVLTALAVLDIGPRASAAYLSTASRSVGAGVAASTTVPNDTTESPADPAHAHREFNRTPLLAHLPTDGGTTSTSGSSSAPTAPAAALPPKDPPADNLAVYFREPAERLELRDHVEFLLDPPRQV
jgi:hypothetical protein